MASSASLSPSPSDSAPWVPSMPNSDLYTLLFIEDHVDAITPVEQRGLRPLPRRVMVVRTSPLARFPPVSAASLNLPAAPTTTVSSVATPFSGNGPNQTDIPRLRQGAPFDVVLLHIRLRSHICRSAKSRVPAGCSSSCRINSSTIKRRTKRFPARVLSSIAEDPDHIPTSSSASAPACQILGTRKRSYAATIPVTTEAPIKSPRLNTGRRITPTLGSSRCAQTTLGNAMATTPGTAWISPRYTSLGTPLADPVQVQTPRAVVASYGGSLVFRLLDGTAPSIMAATREEDGAADGLKSTRDEHCEHPHGEDKLINLPKVSSRLQFGARPMKMLFRWFI
ncbi:hypothetical protein C8R43DRAFT_1162014 [Mycena crocata]|nr:hypothetical protein C8R43DRAFT_1162014 [Mycena crocata]